jgi:hypothetical protein
MVPDLSTRTKFKWKMAGSKIEISNPGGQVFGYIYRKGKVLVFDLTDDVKSGEFDRYKEAGPIEKFFLVAGHGTKDTNLYRRKISGKPIGAEELSNKPFREIFDVAQTVLDWAGLIPGYGDAIDLVNAIIYFARGRKLEGALSLIAIVPWAGSLVNLGIKNVIKTVRFGGRAGLDAIQAAMQSEKAFLEMWRRNGRQRKSVREFFKKLTAFSKTNIKQLLLKAVSLLKRSNQAPALTPIAEELVKRYGDDFAAYIGKNAADGERLLRIAEEGADELFLATTVKTFSKGAKKEILVTTSKFFRNTAPDALGKMWRNLLAMLPKKVWDSVASNMVNSFIALCRKKPEIFVSSILNTPGGKLLFLNMMSKQQASLVYWVKKAAFNIPGQAFDINMITRLGLPADLLTSTGARNIDIEIWNAIVKIINSGSGYEIYKKIIVPFFYATKKEAGAIIGDVSPKQWFDEFITATINNGNIIFVEYTKTFWARFSSLMPNAIHKTYDAGRVLGTFKYDWRQKGITEPLFESVQSWLGKNAGSWVGSILKSINTVLYTIQRLFTKPKSLDIVYNEFQDVLEKAGVYTKDQDQRQGFFVSLLAWMFGADKIYYVYQNYIQPVLKSVSTVASKIAPGNKSDPGNYDFVKRDNKGNVSGTKFQTPTKKGLATAP